jgi:WD40 repeat protein
MSFRSFILIALFLLGFGFDKATAAELKKCVDALSAEANSRTSNVNTARAATDGMAVSAVDVPTVGAGSDARVQAAIKELAQAKIDLEDARITGSMPQINIMALTAEIDKKEREIQKISLGTNLDDLLSREQQNQTESINQANMIAAQNVRDRKVDELDAFSKYNLRAQVDKWEGSFHKTKLTRDEKYAVQTFESYVLIRSTTSGRTLRTDRIINDDIEVFDTNHDNSLIAAGYQHGGGLRLIDFNTLTEVRVLASSLKFRRGDSVVFSPSGAQVLSITSRQLIQIFDVNTGAKLCSRKRFSLTEKLGGRLKSSINAINYSPDGKQFLASVDSQIYIFDSNTCDLIKKIKLPKNRFGIEQAIYIDGGKKIITLRSFDNIARIFDVKTGKQVDQITAFVPKGSHAESYLTKNGSHFYVRTKVEPDNPMSAFNVDVYEVSTLKKVLTYNFYGAVLYASSDNKKLFAATNTFIDVFNAETGKRTQRINLHKDNNNSLGHSEVVISADGNTIYQSTENKFSIWEFSSLIPGDGL